VKTLSRMSLCLVIGAGLGACSKPSASTSSTPAWKRLGQRNECDERSISGTGAGLRVKAKRSPGSYVAKLAPVDPPADSKEKAWTAGSGTEATGKGTIELSVDGAGVQPTAPRKVTGDAKVPSDRCGSAGTSTARSYAPTSPERAKAPSAMHGS